MQRSLLITVYLALIAAAIASCSRETPVSYDNTFDPASAHYLPEVPGSLVVDAQSDTGFALTWKDRSQAEEGFTIERLSSMTGYFTTVASLPPNTAQYFDRFSVQPGALYRYRISAYNSNGFRGYSDEAFVRFYFPAPSKISVTPRSNTSVELKWAYAYSLHTTFVIERSVNNGAFIGLASVGKTTFSLVDNTLDSTNTYRYRIKAASKENESPYSPITTMTYVCHSLEKMYTVDLGRAVHSLAFSEDGTKFGAAGMSYALRVWSVSDGSLVRDFNPAGSDMISYSRPFQVVFSPDGKQIAANGTGVNGSMIKIWDIATGTVARELHEASASVAISMCFTRDSRQMVAVGSAGDFRVWDIAEDRIVKSWQAASSAPINFLYATRDGSRLISGGTSGLQFWRVSDWMKLQTEGMGKGEYYSISGDEKYYSAGATVRYLFADNVAATFTNFAGGQTAFAKDNTLLLGRSASGSITIGAVANPSSVLTQQVPYPGGNTFPAIAASPKAYLLAACGSATGTVDIWKMHLRWQAD